MEVWAFKVGNVISARNQSQILTPFQIKPLIRHRTPPHRKRVICMDIRVPAERTHFWTKVLDKGVAQPFPALQGLQSQITLFKSPLGFVPDAIRTSAWKPLFTDPLSQRAYDGLGVFKFLSSPDVAQREGCDARCVS